MKSLNISGGIILSGSNLVPLVRKSGWGVVMLEPITKEPIMFFDNRAKVFNGLVTIDSIFIEEQNVIQEHAQLKNPFTSIEIVKIEYTYFNGNITIKILSDL